MPAALFGVVFSTVNVHIRRYVYPTDDSQLTSAICQPGESFCTVSRGPYVSTAAYFAAIDAAVTTAAGRPPAATTDCAAVDNSNIVSTIIKADALIDSLPGFTLVQSYDTRIAPGCIYDPVSTLFTVPAFTIPAFTDRLGVTIPAVNVPALLLPRP